MNKANISIFVLALGCVQTALPCDRAARMPDLCPSGTQMACIDHIWAVPPRCLDAQDGNRGYCVSERAELKPENAVITVDGEKLNRVPYVLQSNHGFFKDGGVREIRASNWGGSLLLERIDSSVNGTFRARYENHLHGYNVETMMVHCSAK